MNFFNEAKKNIVITWNKIKKTVISIPNFKSMSYINNCYHMSKIKVCTINDILTHKNKSVSDKTILFVKIKLVIWLNSYFNASITNTLKNNRVKTVLVFGE